MNPHLHYLQELNQAAKTFWQTWQAEYPQLSELDDIDFVERSNDILHQTLPDVALELEGHLNGKDSTLVFTANGERDYFPEVQAVVQAAPQNLPHTIRAFRSPIPNLDNDFVIGMDGFQLGIGDIAVRLDEWREMPALEIAFKRDIEESYLDHAQNMVFIILDHLLGEYNAAVKIGPIDFLEQPEDGFFPLSELSEKLDDMWQQLGRSGVYPQPEWEYAFAEVEENEEREQDHLLLTRNQSANSLLGRADMAWIVWIDAELNDDDSVQAAYDLHEEFIGYAAQHQQGIDTLSVTNLSQGIRTVYAATSAPETLLPQAIALCEKYPQLNAKAECEYDPTWAHYHF